MGYNYTTYKAALAELMVVDATTDANFNAILPSIITYAEQRIYRELDLLSTIVRQNGTLTANSRNFTLPSGSGRFVTTQGINVFTPVSTTTTRNQVVPTTRDFLDATWPSETASTTPSIPANYAMITDQTVIFGPPPDAAYTAEIIGTIRPEPLSETNPNTFLTDYLPDLFMAASMIFASGYQKNFGSQSDDPRMAASWESQYELLKASADVEELRKRYQSTAWSSMTPSPLAPRQ